MMSTRTALVLAVSMVMFEGISPKSAHAVLTAGDVAIIGRINNADPDSFAFAALTTINAGEEIYFTDNGWNTTTGFFRGAGGTLDGDGNENLLKFTATTTIPFGKIIQTNTISAEYSFTIAGQVPGGTSGSFANLSLSSSGTGEQIYAFQGPTNLPLQNPSGHLYVFDDSNGFEDGINTNTGNITPGLTLGLDAVTFNPNPLPGVFKFNTAALASGTKLQWLAAIADVNNWTNATSGTLPSGFLGLPGPAALTWNNGTDWNTTGTNWHNGVSVATFANNDSINFTDTNVTTIAVAPNITAGQMNVTNTSGTYEFTTNSFTASGYDQTGGGTVVLSGNGYDLTSSNSLNIKQGTLRLNGGVNTLAADTAVVLGQSATTNDGILDLNGNNQTFFTIEELGSGAQSKVTSAAPALLTINNGSQGFSFDGKIDGAISLALVSNNTGTIVGRTMTLSGTNTYTGTTAITGGTLRINEPASLAGGAVTVNAFGALRLQPVDNAFVTYGTGTQAITINGAGNQLSTELDGDSGALRLASVTPGMSGTTTLNSNVTLGSNATISVAQNEASGTSNMLELAGVYNDGGFTLRKQGTGTLKLMNQANVATGGTVVGNGLVVVVTGSSLGTGPLGIANSQGFGPASPFNITSDVVTGVEFNNVIQTIGSLSNSWVANAIDFGKTAEARIAVNGTALTINQTVDGEFGVIPTSLLNGSLSQFSVKLTGTGSITKAGPATLTLSSTNTYTGNTTVTAGKLITKNAIQNEAGMFISGNGTVEVPVNGSSTGVTSLTSINIPASGANFAGTLELHDNDLIIKYDETLGVYATVLAMVKSGLPLLGFGGNGTGITSAEVQSQTLPGTMLAVVDGGATGGLVTSLSGYPVADPTQSVLVKYTWRGDANLDGVVNGSDYALADTGFSGGGSGWFYGDMNYDGTINGSDYALIDTGFSSQTGPLPEPAMLGLLALGALGLSGRRRRI